MVFVNVLVCLEVVLQCDKGSVYMVMSLVAVLLMLVVGVGFFHCWMAINVQNELIFVAKLEELVFEMTMGIVVVVRMVVTIGAADSWELGATNINHHLGGGGQAVWLVIYIRHMPFFSE